jgi:hypothetical protein
VSSVLAGPSVALYLPKSTSPYRDFIIILTPDMYVFHEHKYIIAGFLGEHKEVPGGGWWWEK